MKKGWAVEPLGDLCDILDSMRKPVTKKDRVTGDIPYYGATGIQDYVAEYLFDEPLVLVGEDGAKWGAGDNTAFAVSGRCWVNNHAHVLRPHRNQLVDNWLIYYLNATNLSEYVSGLTVPKLNQGNLRQIPIPVPPLPEQRRIVAILDEAFEVIASAKTNAERNLRNAKAGFESQLQFVFTQRGPEWGEKPLGQISEFKNGLNYSKSSKGQKLPVVGVADFQGNYLVPFAQLQSATIDGTLADNYAIQPNDILTVRSNGSKQLVGRCMLVGDVDEATSYSGFIIRIRFDTETISPRFLLYFMKCQSTRDILTAGGGGANITNINQEKLSSLLVPLPPYSDQIAVVALLDSCRAETHGLASVYSRKLAALDELKASLLHQAFAGQL